MPKLSKVYQYKGTYYGPEDSWADVPEKVREVDEKARAQNSGPKDERPQTASDAILLEDALDFPHRNKLMAHDPPIKTVAEAQGYPDHLLLKIRGVGAAGLNEIKNWKPEKR